MTNAKLIDEIIWAISTTGEEFQCVHVDFAREQNAEIERLQGEYNAYRADGEPELRAANAEIMRLLAKLDSIRARCLNLAQWIDKGCDPKHGATEASFIALFAKEPSDEPLEPLANWQPIESAPKDGSYILALFHGESYWPVRVLRWGGDQSLWGLPGHCGLEPTHWMPLPANPTTPGASQDASSEPISVIDWPNKCCTKCRKPLVYESQPAHYAGWRLDCVCWDEPPAQRT